MTLSYSWRTSYSAKEIRLFFILRSVFTIFDLRPKIGCASAKEINLIYFILRSVFTIFVS